MSEKEKRTIRVVAGLLRDEEGRVLVTQRRPQAYMPLKWEFPGGKVEPGETDPQALERELSEELAIKVCVGEHFMGLVYSYPDFDIDFHVYECSLVSGTIQKIAVHNFRWVQVDELESIDFPPADQSTVAKLVEE